METLEQTRLRLETFVKDNNPDADTAPGSVLSELLIKLAATLHNPIKADIDAINQADSVQTAILSASDTFSPAIDKIASNYNVTRNEGRKVAGKVKITVTTKKNYFIDRSFELVQSNLNSTYQATQDYAVVNKNSADLLNGEVKIFQEGALYYFIISVEAEDVGSTDQVANRTKFTLGTNSRLPEFVQAEAYGAFTSGQPKESDKELINRFKQGLSVKNLVSVNAISSVLKNQFPTLKSISVIGANDNELQRAKNNLFGIAVPGLSDVYVRTVESLETTKLTITGTQITTGINAGKWTFTLDVDDAPGFYRILSILPVDSNSAGTQVIDSLTYSFELPSGERQNDVNSALEARFTKYQTCTVIFEYDGTTATQDFIVTVLAQPFIKDIQDVFLSDDNRVTCADYLVKAVVPCNVSIYLKLFKKFPLDVIPVNLIKKDIFTYVNNIPFGESLYVSKIIDICHNYDIKAVSSPVVIRGSILTPDAVADTTINISSNDQLDIPTDIEKGVSPLTTAFFINYFDNNGDENIGVEVV